MYKLMKTNKPGIYTQGSSMTEFAVLTLAMLPIMIGIPMVGKMIDLKQTTINASRYSAWEATVASGTIEAAQVNSRFFQNSDGAIKTQAVQHESHQLWGETSGTAPDSYMDKGSVRISDSSVVSNSSDTNHTQNVSDARTAAVSFGGVVKDVGEILSWAPGTDWGISQDGLLNAEVQVKVKENDFLNGENTAACNSEDGTFACMTASNSIMVDNWSASSDRQAADRTRSFVPTTAIRDVSDILAAIGNVPVFKELKGLERKNGMNGFGHVDMTKLPKLLDQYPE